MVKTPYNLSQKIISVNTAYSNAPKHHKNLNEINLWLNSIFGTMSLINNMIIIDKKILYLTTN